MRKLKEDNRSVAQKIQDAVSSVTPEEVEAYNHMMEADQKAEEEAKRQEIIDQLAAACIPEPKGFEEVEVFKMKEGEDEVPMVKMTDYMVALNFINSEAPNAHMIPNADYLKAVDLLRHATGCLKAIYETHIPGSVSERLDKVKKMARETAEGIEKTLGVHRAATSNE